jgi:hypothetical protein
MDRATRSSGVSARCSAHRSPRFSANRALARSPSNETVRNDVGDGQMLTLPLLEPWNVATRSSS